MRSLFFIVTILIALISPVSALIPFAIQDVGQTYILWNWTTAEETVDIYIDGNLMCGYETNNTWFLLTGLKPDELHTIDVITATDSGSNSTKTLASTANGTFVAVASQPYDDTFVPVYIAAGMICGGLAVAAMAQRGIE